MAQELGWLRRSRLAAHDLERQRAPATAPGIRQALSQLACTGSGRGGGGGGGGWLELGSYILGLMVFAGCHGRRPEGYRHASPSSECANLQVHAATCTSITRHVNDLFIG